MVVDITYDDLVNANKKPEPVEADGINGDSLMEYGKIALSILEQFNLAKGQRVTETRQPEQRTTGNMEVQTPMVDVKQIKDTLETVKTLKGDVKISQLLKLLEENKGTVEKLLAGI